MKDKQLSIEDLETLYILSVADTLRDNNNPYKFPDGSVMSSRDIVRFEVTRLKETDRVPTKWTGVKRLENLTERKLIENLNMVSVKIESASGNPGVSHRIITQLTNKGRKVLEKNMDTLRKYYGDRINYTGHPTEKDFKTILPVMMQGKY